MSDEASDYITRGRWCPTGEQWCDDVLCNSIRCRTAMREDYEAAAGKVLNNAFRKWSDGGGTGLVDWTGDLGPGLQVDHTKVAK